MSRWSNDEKRPRRVAIFECCELKRHNANETLVFELLLLSTIGLAYKTADTLCEMPAGGKNKHINKKQN